MTGDASVPILKGLTNLKELRVGKNITNAATEELKQALPNANVLGSFPN